MSAQNIALLTLTVALSGTVTANRFVTAAGDMPSARVMRSLLAHAAAKGIPLKPEHLIWGAPAAEVEALLKQMAAASPEAAE